MCIHIHILAFCHILQFIYIPRLQGQRISHVLILLQDYSPISFRWQILISIHVIVNATKYFFIIKQDYSRRMPTINRIVSIFNFLKKKVLQVININSYLDRISVKLYLRNFRVANSTLFPEFNYLRFNSIENIFF